MCSIFYLALRRDRSSGHLGNKSGKVPEKLKKNIYISQHKTKNEGYFFMVSNDAEGHDDQNAYWIVKIGAILEG